MKRELEISLEQTRKSLADARCKVEGLSIADEKLEAYLLRIVNRLEALVENPPVGTGERILEQALAVFLPILELDWVSVESSDRSELAPADRQRIEKLRQERRLMAFQNSSVPLGDARYKLALIDLLVESLAIFIIYRNQDTELACLGLLMNLLEKDPPVADRQQGPVWVS